MTRFIILAVNSPLLSFAPGSFSAKRFAFHLHWHRISIAIQMPNYAQVENGADGYYFRIFQMHLQHHRSMVLYFLAPISSSLSPFLSPLLDSVLSFLNMNT